MDAMVNQYTIPSINVARNAFVRNHSWKGDCKVGMLYPVFFDEVLPGDTKQLNSTFFGRINPTVTAPLDNVWLDYHLFYVPNRELWNHWPNFLGEKKNPDDSIDYLVPTITAGESGFTPNELIDYLGVPPSVPSLSCSSLIFYLRAYNKIWNEWYRSELYQDSVDEIKGDTGDTESIYKLLPRGKRQDYFTSAFATPQNGVGSSIPLGNVQFGGSITTNASGPLSLKGSGTSSTNLTMTKDSSGFGTIRGYEATGANSIVFNSMVASGYSNTGEISNTTSNYFTNSGTSTPSMTVGNGDSDKFRLFYKSGIGVNFNSLTGTLAPVSINTLRQAIALQQFLERDLFGGSRLIELILSHFGVRVPDYRLDRAEYLGGCSTRVNINPVTQVSSTDSTSPQGNITGNGVVSSTSGGFTHSFTEHGVILGLVSFRVDQNYQQGVDRHFLRNSRYDYFWPTLAHLGMQGIYNKEIFAQGDDVVDSDYGINDPEYIVDNQLFGYNMRNSEYRFKNSYITGTLRSSHSASLDIWHLAENFEELPKLNSEFIETSDTLQRIMTVQSVPEIILDVWHDFTDVREVPMYGMPGLERI